METRLGQDPWEPSARRQVLGIKVDGRIAPVTISLGEYRLATLIPADAASELRLKIGETSQPR